MNLEQFDQKIDSVFDLIRGNSIADTIFNSATTVADHSILWMAWAGLRLFDDKKKCSGMRIIISMPAESVLVNGIIKSFFRRKRPQFPSGQSPQVRVPITSSFPSGHASAAYCAAILLSDKKVLAKKIPYFLVATIVALSRIHTRLHHGSDVLAGAIVGAVLGILILEIAPLEQNNFLENLCNITIRIIKE